MIQEFKVRLEDEASSLGYELQLISAKDGCRVARHTHMHFGVTSMEWSGHNRKTGMYRTSVFFFVFFLHIWGDKLRSATQQGFSFITNKDTDSFH